jgi:hypothetical protein
MTFFDQTSARASSLITVVVPALPTKQTFPLAASGEVYVLPMPSRCFSPALFTGLSVQCNDEAILFLVSVHDQHIVRQCRSDGFTPAEASVHGWQVHDRTSERR